MANFKLNSVLVASESGGTIVLDSATSLSGVTIPAAGITGTLPNAVQDNITRLGTVTSGTFPAGHVVQVKTSDYKNKRSVGGWVTASSYSWSTYSCAVTMTNCIAGNNIILIGTDSGYQGEWDKVTGWTWFVKDGANSEVNISDLAINSGGMEGASQLGELYINNSANDWGSIMGVNGWYTVQGSSGSSIEFRLCAKVNTASTNIWNSWQSTGLAMEVQA